MRPSTDSQAPNFVQVRSDLLKHGLPSGELHVYLLLLDFAGPKSVCWVSDRTIGRCLGKSQDTASRLLSGLESRGLISRKKVEITEENPTGRLIITHDRVPPTAKTRQGSPRHRGKGAAGRPRKPAAKLREELDSQKQHAGGSEKPGGTGSPPPAGQDPEESPLPQAEVARMHREMIRRPLPRVVDPSHHVRAAGLVKGPQGFSCERQEG